MPNLQKFLMLLGILLMLAGISLADIPLSAKLMFIGAICAGAAYIQLLMR